MFRLSRNIRAAVLVSRPPSFIINTPRVFFTSKQIEDESDNDFQPKAKAPMSNDQLKETFTKWINANDIVVFMKGTKQ